MQLNELRSPCGANKALKRKGRGSGSGHGKTSGRGHRGQKARSGKDISLGFEGGQMPLTRRIPKRGFKSKSKKEYQIVNLRNIEKFKKDIFITPKELKKQNLIKRLDVPIKILAKGKLITPLKIKAHSFSRAAIEKIRQAGGEIEVINA